MKSGRWNRGIYFHKSNKISVLYRLFMLAASDSVQAASLHISGHIAHLRQQWHISKSVIFQEKRLMVLKCYTFLLVQRRHNCSPAASFANCVMTLYLFKVHLQKFFSILINKKCQILSCRRGVDRTPHLAPRIKKE